MIKNIKYIHRQVLPHAAFFCPSQSTSVTSLNDLYKSHSETHFFLGFLFGGKFPQIDTALSRSAEE